MCLIFVRALKLTTALLYGTVVLWSPIAHAQREAISSDPVIEAGHSGDCSVLHVEIACTIGGAVEGPRGLSAAYAPPQIVYRLRPASSSSSIPSSTLLSPKSERGPPARRS